MKTKRSIKENLPELSLLALIFLVSIGVIYLTELQPVIPDSLGYIVAGQNLGLGQGLNFTDVHNLHIAPFFYLHAFRMVEANSASAAFGYPPGVPLLIAIGVLLSGQANAAYYVVPFLGILVLPLTYWLGYLLSANKWVGFWSAFLLSSTYLFWQFSSSAWSEIPSSVFLVSGVACYYFSRQKLTEKRAAIVASVFGGVFIGFSFFIRYTNVILVMPTLLLYEIYAARLKILTERNRWLFFIITGLFAGGILLFNWLYLGGAFNSIYSTPALGAYPWPYFSLNYAFGASPVSGFSFTEAVLTLWNNFHILLILVPIGWIWVKKPQWLLPCGVVLTTFFLYSIYAFPPKDINARFLLPMFPFLSILIAWPVITIGQKYFDPRWYALVFFVAVFWFGRSIPLYADQLQQRNQANGKSIDYVRQLTNQVPENAVWLSTGINDLVFVYGHQSALNYRRMLITNPDTGQFDVDRYEGCLVQALDRLLESDTPVYFILDEGWNTATIIKNYFALTGVPFDQNTYEVKTPLEGLARDGLAPCH